MCFEKRSNQFKPKTLEYIENQDLEERKELGQYFTPQKIRKKLIKELPSNFSDKKALKVLDPGCGTGEFLLSAKNLLNQPKLCGWDIDKKMVKISKKIIPEAKIQKTNTLKIDTQDKFDLIVGNPPYYELNPDKEIKKRYKEIINGRTNIYKLFIYKGIKLLKKGGYLAFITPPSMNNGAYFSKLRKYIIKNCNIEYLNILDDNELFTGAQQPTMLLILKKEENRGNYIFTKNGITIFSENAEYLKEKFKNTVSLKEMGYKVKTGSLIWNENKELLTDKSKNNTPLIWSHNITKNGLKLENHKKPQYIKIKNPNQGPAIVVNRVVGKPGKAKIKAALIPKKMEFIAENHVNVIFPPTKKQTKITKNGIKPKKTLDIKQVLNQLNSPKKLKIIQNITGNTQISKNELAKLFPFNLDK